MSLGDILFETLAEMMGVPVKKQQPKRPPPPPQFEEEADAVSDEDEWAYSEAEDVSAPAGPAPAGVRSAALAARAYAEAPHLDITAHAKESGVAPAPTDRSVGLPPGLVEDLRSDPAAARKAFLYGEIFGPPLADRGDR